jgi:hypothetical protein
MVLVPAAFGAGRASAEMLSAWFPEGVPGYDTAAGVTVRSRLHPEQMPLGVRAGTFQFWPRLDESVGFTSNASPGPNQRGSWQIVTEPTLVIGSDWSRNAFGAVLSAQDTRYLSLPDQNRTNATASAGGRFDLGGNPFTLGVAHLNQHEDRSQLDTIASDRPIAFQINDVRASYTWNVWRWAVVPSLQASQWSYGATTIAGVPASQSYRDRLVTQGALTLRYEWAPLRNLLFVVRALGQDYTHTPPGQPTPNSTGYQVLGGFDYDDNAVWRWRLLFGGEARLFTLSLYRQQTTAIAEAGAAWSPSGLTTVGFTLGRETADAAQAGVSGLTYSTARLTIDHEYLRNLLLKTSIGLQRADYFQGGYQIGGSAGAGIVWVMNRSMRMSVTYDQTELHGSQGQPSPGYSSGLGLITMRIGL